MAFTAWTQLREARSLNEDIQKLLGEDSQPEKQTNRKETSTTEIEEGTTQSTTTTFLKRHPWTIMHSFYVVMGGFAFDTTGLPDNKRFLPGDRDRVTLSAAAVRFLAEHEPSVLPDLSEEELKDRSKANALAKGLVCVQTIYFIIQCIFRLSEGLSISLLELNTCAHAICAIVIYGLWWHKPLDIGESYLIRGEKMHTICALLCHFSILDGVAHSGQLVRQPPKEGKAVLCLPADGAQIDTPGMRSRLERGERAKIYFGQRIAGLFFFPFSGRSWRRAGGYLGEDGVLSQTRQCLEFSALDLRRWDLVSRGLSQYGDPARLDPQRLLMDRVPNWPAGFHIVRDIIIKISMGWFGPNNELLAFTLAFTFAGLAYGGLHLLAWNAPFASEPQRLLWRVSATSIAASGPAYLLVTFVAYILDEIFMFLNTYHDVSYYIELVAMAGLVYYTFARTFLVVETFLELPYLPDIVFQQPRWTPYFPHVT